eukprot:CAMPEP_0170510412 /NCGR_PEP_ID=MMETSP0208-20121228/65749_1 /TAXON_ID=197538 /ORGANISM="Strombidium inclinatum, Strain S3" /LENGTH=198 /DNA_ID=CAMNT_0010793867 /DNA_START=387 /DNA_END=983 /DNA_ORIENTATION=+
MKFERAFGKIFDSDNQSKQAQRVEHLMGVTEVIEVPAISLIMEIYFQTYYRAGETKRDLLVALISLIQTFLPWAMRRYFGLPIFSPDVPMFYEFFIAFPKGLLIFTNYSSFFLLMKMYFDRKRYKQIFVAMLDCTYASQYQIRTNLPQINMFDPLNQEVLMDIYRILGSVNNRFMKRAMVQSTLITAIFSIQALYVYA